MNIVSVPIPLIMKNNIIQPDLKPRENGETIEMEINRRLAGKTLWENQHNRQHQGMVSGKKNRVERPYKSNELSSDSRNS